MAVLVGLFRGEPPVPGPLLDCLIIKSTTDLFPVICSGLVKLAWEAEAAPWLEVIGGWRYSAFL